MARLVKPLLILLAALMPLLAQAEETAFAPVAAADVAVDDYLYLRRPVIVFANTSDDPAFIRQLELLERYYPDLEERDVILIIDTDPAGESELRQRLRPTGFSLVLMDKDWRTTIRKPLPWDGREITRAIDKMPIAREEALQRHPSGR